VALIELAGALAIAFVAVVWALVKLARYELQSDEGGVLGLLNHVLQAWKLLVFGVLAVEIGPPVGAWLYDAFGFLITVISHA
jgi:hypothetical protein